MHRHYVAINLLRRHVIDIRLWSKPAATDAAQTDLLDVHGHEFPLARRAGPEFLEAARAIAGHDEFVTPLQGDFDRNARLFGELAGKLPFGADAAFGSEPAAHVMDDAGDVGFVQAQLIRRITGDGKGSLGRTVNR